MSDVVISVEHLSKRYSLGAGRSNERYSALRDVLADAAATLFWRCSAAMRGSRPPVADLESADSLSPAARGRAPINFLALRDISFRINRGEVVGIIGRNGAGKSTLLKIVSRITEPSAGRVRIKGRVASLLEVGTGFHPELTGRENIFLNGAILGMSRAEIRRKFDEIVGFAEVERFIDTPVKHFSSGMYMRLAFAVAAHLDPEILVVDEVLAVGDFRFQNKCLGRMSEISREGRTVLFVSHNMAAVQALCGRIITLSNGTVVADGLPRPVIAGYVAEQGAEVTAEYDLTTVARGGGKMPLMRMVRIRNEQGDLAAQVFCGQRLTLEFDLGLPRRFGQLHLGIGVDDSLGQRVFSVATYLSASSLPQAEGDVTLRCQIENLPLAPGRYALSLSAGNHQDYLMDQVADVVRLDVVEADFYRNNRTPTAQHGQVLMRSTWEVSPG